MFTADVAGQRMAVEMVSLVIMRERMNFVLLSALGAQSCFYKVQLGLFIFPGLEKFYSSRKEMRVSRLFKLREDLKVARGKLIVTHLLIASPQEILHSLLS